MDNTFKSPAVISFCPGILGIERGLKRAGIDCRVAAYVEIEAFIIANLVAGMESGVLDPAPIWTDAKTFNASPFRGKIHGIIGGYPCPGESLAGLREGHLYKGFIWPAIRRAIAAARPLFCYFENVDDHLTGTYPIVQRSLRNMGYAVEAGVFSAEEVGAPHERQRLFILAISEDYRHELRSAVSEWNNRQLIEGVSIRKEVWSQPIGCGEELADPYCNDSRGFTRNLYESSGEVKNETYRENRKWSGNEYRDGGKEMVNSFDSRCREYGRCISVQKEQSRNQHASVNQFPAGQGEHQYDWEEPRTIEPGLGCTIDGYKFREDLLRALGNSVVEQTAELAFRTLIQKLIK